MSENNSEKEVKIKRETNRNQKGGGGRIVPLFKEPMNSPYLSNEQKVIHRDRMEEKYGRDIVVDDKTGVPMTYDGQTPVPRGVQPREPLLNLQLYNPPKPTRPPEPQMSFTKMDLNTFMAAAVPSPFMPPQFTQYGTSYPATAPMPPTVIQQYSINTSGPMDNHQKLSMIYEDALPTINIPGKITTLRERNTLTDYIRSVMFSDGDAGDISLEGNSPNSLLSHLKFMDLNPYNTFRFSRNPYKGLPRRFLIYRSCYPIRRDSKTGHVGCARTSIGMNIRIYELPDEAYNPDNYKKEKIDFDMWRDVFYYEFIREEVLRKNMCPNFVGIHGYYVSENSKINFDKIEDIQNTGEKTDTIGFAGSKPPTFIPKKKDSVDPEKIALPHPGSAPLPVRPSEKTPTEKFVAAGPIAPVLAHGAAAPGTMFRMPTPATKGRLNIVEIKPGRTASAMTTAEKLRGKPISTKALVALTESPLYNIVNWASKTYQMEGNIKKMIATGYHNEKIWHSVLFQIMAALYVLQIKGIKFNNFTFEDNVYVKDLALHQTATTYWKYKINGIDYYVPNYGYLVLIDTSFKDFGSTRGALYRGTAPPTTTPGTVVAAPRTSKFFKIQGKIFKETESPSQDETFEHFKKVFDTNNFSKTFEDNGGCKPPAEILAMLEKIKSEYSGMRASKNIGDYIKKYMLRFVHNRTGTYLKETEIPNVRDFEMDDLSPGELVILEVGANTYKFVVYVDEMEHGDIEIIDKRDKEMIITRVNANQLKRYSRGETVTQTYRPGESSLAEEELLETYVIAEETTPVELVAPSAPVSSRTSPTSTASVPGFGLGIGAPTGPTLPRLIGGGSSDTAKSKDSDSHEQVSSESSTVYSFSSSSSLSSIKMSSTTSD